MKHTWIGLLLAALGLWATPAQALPRFAARTGADCGFCHVNPSGGGIRNRYGSHVFQQLILPMRLGDAEEGDLGFSGQVSDWLSLGADVRAAYLHSQAAAVGGAPAPEATSSFFLMQADLYAAARLGRHLAVVLDLGAYSGFEAYLLWQAAPDSADLDLYVKVGHFMPTFGLRDVNHDLYTRSGIGLGATDRDTGLEVTGVLGPLTLAVSVLNGTFNDGVLDRNGAAERSFEKAVAGRLSWRLGNEWLHAQVGASAYYNDNVDASNPLFIGSVDAANAAAGVDELRLGAHLLLGLGRFSYQGELVYVQDRLQAGSPARVSGYASAQELAAVILPGLEAMLTLEFREPDLDLVDDASLRLGGAVEVFPLPFAELRLMVRRSFESKVSAGDVTDVLCFVHGAF